MKNRLYELIDKSYKRKGKRRISEEDAEVPTTSATVNPVQTAIPSNVQAATLAIQNDENDDEDDDEMDATINYIINQLSQQKNNQYKYDTSEAALRQQQADQIIKDIQDYIKQNKK